LDADDEAERTSDYCGGNSCVRCTTAKMCRPVTWVGASTVARMAAKAASRNGFTGMAHSSRRGSNVGGPMDERGLVAVRFAA
jgi:hypothetical protein